MGRRVQLSHSLAQGMEQTAIFWHNLIFKLLCLFEMFSISFFFPISYTNNPLTSRKSPTLFHLRGSQASFSPRGTSRKLSHSTQAGSLWGKSKKQGGRGWAVVWKRPWNILRLQAGYGMFPGLWNMCQKLEDHSQAQPDTWGAVCSEP